MSTTQNPPRDGEGDRAQRGGGGVPFTRRPETYTARKLRREMSLPEVQLWKRLRASQLGVTFRKQHSMPPYVLDFYCPSVRLVVEVDGVAHDNAERQERDMVCERFLAAQGCDVLRMPATLILSDMEAALAAIAARVESPLRQPLRGCHLPASGEDL